MPLPDRRCAATVSAHRQQRRLVSPPPLLALPATHYLCIPYPVGYIVKSTRCHAAEILASRGVRVGGPHQMIATSPSTTTGDGSAATPPARRGLGRLGRLGRLALAGGSAHLAGGPGPVRDFRYQGPVLPGRRRMGGLHQPVGRGPQPDRRDFAGLGSSALQVVVVDHNATLSQRPGGQGGGGQGHRDAAGRQTGLHRCRASGWSVTVG